MSEIVDIALAG